MILESFCINTNDKIFVDKNMFTSSTLGRSKGHNEIYLQNWVKYNGIIHEIMHNLGFMHEHKRQDRDLFVKSLSNDSNFIINKEIYPIGPFDPEPIMHYRLDYDLEVSDNSLLTKVQMNKLRDFAKNLSEGDIEALNFIYGGENIKCSLKEYGSDFLSQAYYECEDCWGENNV